MATSTTTIRPITTTCVVCGSDGECLHGLFGFERLYQAYLDCRQTKRNTINSLRFEADLYANLHRLSDELAAGDYWPSRSLCFVARKPKLREIFAADFRDRVVHHLLVGALQPYFEPTWIFDSFACRAGKGTHAAVARLRQFLRQATHNGNRPAYFLQLDIRSFFMSIHKPTLFELIHRRIAGATSQQPLLPGMWRPTGNRRLDALLHLTQRIIFNDPTANFIYKGDPRLLAMVPAHKSLFGVAKDRGLPIGNLTSQFFAGVYLNVLDQFVKRQLKISRYIRYVDDVVILAESDRCFDEWTHAINGHLATALKLQLKPQSRRQGRVSNGIDFLGYVVRPSHTLVRRRVVNQCKQQLLRFESLLVRNHTWGQVYWFELDLVERLLAVVNGYAAHFARANAQRLLESLAVNNPFLSMYFDIKLVSNPEPRLVVSRRYPIAGTATTLVAQIGAIRRLRKGEILFVQVGAYYELFDADASVDLGLRPQRRRRGFRRRCGFPVTALDQFVPRALAMGRPVAIVTEGQHRIGALKIRQWQQTIIPHGAPHGAL